MHHSSRDLAHNGSIVEVELSEAGKPLHFCVLLRLLS